MKITEELLLSLGFKKETFFFSIGDGEDEDDMQIFVKDNIAYGKYLGDQWYVAPYESLTYVNGFPDNAPVRDIPE